MLVQKYVKKTEAYEKNAQWVTKQFLIEKMHYTKLALVALVSASLARAVLGTFASSMLWLLLCNRGKWPTIRLPGPKAKTFYG